MRWGENPFLHRQSQWWCKMIYKAPGFRRRGPRSCRPHRIKFPEEQRPRLCTSLLHTSSHVLFPSLLPGQVITPISQKKKPKLRETSRRTQSLDSEPESSHGRVHALSRMPHGKWYKKGPVRSLRTNHSAFFSATSAHVPLNPQWASTMKADLSRARGQKTVLLKTVFPVKAVNYVLKHFLS